MDRWDICAYQFHVVMTNDVYINSSIRKLIMDQIILWIPIDYV